MGFALTPGHNGSIYNPPGTGNQGESFSAEPDFLPQSGAIPGVFLARIERLSGVRVAVYTSKIEVQPVKQKSCRYW